MSPPAEIDMKIRMHSLLYVDALAFLFFASVSGHVAADQLSEDWRSAATESLRSGRPIVAVFGDVAPSLKDELAAALTSTCLSRSESRVSPTTSRTTPM